MPEREGGRGKAADKGSVFRSFQQVTYRIFRAMHQQVGGDESRFEGAGSGCRRSLGTAIGMRDGGKVGPSKFLAIDVASQKVLDTGTIGSGRGTKDARDRSGCARTFPPSGAKRVLVGWVFARCNRAHRCVDKRDLGGEQVAEQT